MNMTINLLDIFCFFLLLGLVPTLIKHRSFWLSIPASAPRSIRIALALSAAGAVLSVILYGVSVHRRELNVMAAAIGAYGFSFYALVYLVNPLLRLRLKMPWRTSIRFYLLFFLAGFTTYKLGGVDKCYYFFIFCGGLGALFFSRYSITQTLVMVFQLLATIAILWWAPSEAFWFLLAAGIAVNMIPLVSVRSLIVEEENA